MPNDYENALNLDQMQDEDIRRLVRQMLDEADDFNVDAVDVEIEDGRIVVTGRVGTDAERQRVDQLLSRLGAEDYQNDVVVDANARAQRADAADTARNEDASSSPALGVSGENTTDSAQHLEEDVSGEMYGTRDMKKAIEEGKSYNPPDGPVQEGIRGGETH